jgi:hypothetical protein
MYQRKLDIRRLHYLILVIAEISFGTGYTDLPGCQ